MRFTPTTLEALAEQSPSSARAIEQGAMSNKAFIELGLLVGASTPYVASSPFKTLLRYHVTPGQGYDSTHPQFLPLVETDEYDSKNIFISGLRQRAFILDSFLASMYIIFDEETPDRLRSLTPLRRELLFAVGSSVLQEWDEPLVYTP